MTPERKAAVAEHVNVFSDLKIVGESLLEKPLRVKGLAICVGMSRNRADYQAEELKAFAKKLLGAPVYIEHARAENAIGKVVKVDWDGRNLWYEAEIFDEDWAAKITAGIIKHVSVGYDYQTMDFVNGHIPRGLGDAELSLVAIGGIPAANIEPITENFGTESLSPPFQIGELKEAEDETPITVSYEITANPQHLTKNQVEALVKERVLEDLAGKTPSERTEGLRLKIETETEKETAKYVPESLAEVRMGDILLNIKRKEEGEK